MYRGSVGLPICVALISAVLITNTSSASVLDGIPENSSDWERGAAPQSIGEGFVGIPSVVIDIRVYPTHRLSQKWCTYWEPNCVLFGRDDGDDAKRGFGGSAPYFAIL